MGPRSTFDAEHEQIRRAALRSYGILDTGPDPEFDSLVQRAARECGYRAAVLSFMDGDRCWFKATAGLMERDQGLREMPRNETFCHYALASSGLLVVRDARQDPRFSGLAVVNRTDGYRAYAGAQLITPDGHSIGTLCVLDGVAREPTAEQRTALRRLAIDAMALLESRRFRDNAPGPSVVTVAAAPPRRRGVLVVDDEVVVRRFVEYVLRERGTAAFVAGDGMEALALYRAHAGEIGLVLTDMNMPVKDGFELISDLKREANPPLFAVMSGRMDPLMRAQLNGMGITRVLAKPFALEEMNQVLALVGA